MTNSIPSGTAAQKPNTDTGTSALDDNDDVVRRHRLPAEPEAIEWRDVFERAERITHRLFGILEQLQEGDNGRWLDKSGTEGAPLPDWVTERIGNSAQRRELYDEYDQHREVLKEMLRLAHGEGSAYGFEVWCGKMYCSRLSIRLESMKEAMTERDWWRNAGGKADAYIVRVGVRDRVHGEAACEDPALLETLIGAIWHCATTFRRGSEQDEISIQDVTGRVCSQPANLIRAHPVFARMNGRDQERIDHSILVAKNRGALFAEAQRNGGAA